MVIRGSTRSSATSEAVVYLPQGHLEQVCSSTQISPLQIPTFDLPPQIVCRVVAVHLLANKENDEVYTELILLPLSEAVGTKSNGKEDKNVGWEDDEENGHVAAKSTTHMFCKTLTASDTSTHGGFSVPRRAAEDCFPPLDYKEQRPSQELVAKDLHGVEWKFRHIYRGQPRRHLLTTGWSLFVSQKNLVSGDAVLFLRGESGELRLGIRRAARPRNGVPDSIIKSQSSYPSVLAPVANALSNNGTFRVFCSPRYCHADFIVPYQKYLKCTASNAAVGTRFITRFGLDDSPERRFSGVVTGVRDADSFRWPNSKWRCLMVKWDEDMTTNHQERVSPWEIDFSSNYAPLSIESSPRTKRLRSTLHASHDGSSITRNILHLDFEQHERASKVLQGQENIGLTSSPLSNSEGTRRYLGFEILSSAHIPLPNGIERTNEYSEYVSKPAHATFKGFLESDRFPKVLQGQEICSLSSLAGKNHWNLGHLSNKTIFASNNFNMYHGPMLGFYPLASEGARTMPFTYKDIYGGRRGIKMQTNNFDVLTGNYVTTPTSVLTQSTSDVFEGRTLTKENPTNVLMHLKNMSGEDNLEKIPSCKLFGFSLVEDPAVLNSQGQSPRMCVEVHKRGSLVGRAIDLSRLQGYNELLTHLERLFNLEGLLHDPKHGWRILYTDSDDEMMVVGDDPWCDFVEVATKIHVLTQDEVDKMMVDLNSDDTQSCLEEAQHFN
ncbi:Auxin response factor 4 [Striga hermonthica]|uniref:Auxin response factor n=1 Tax=Striga hermonthica TaxID=68872 RepID=A0A9N7MSD2_STRHE|nr:Auxin response factor 4 [Striga hermonthica]